MADKYKQVTTALLSTTLLLLASHQAKAQTMPASPSIASSNPYNQSIATQQADSFQVLHVNPLAGDDLYGNGQQHQPFKTISHALAAAEPNTVILLAPGRYTSETGETFPLVLQPGVTLQGNTGSGSQSAIVVGGGAYQSPALSRQNVTIVTADRSGVANLVISNPNDQGTGIWIEAGSPIIRDSGFVANRHTGVYVVSGNPVIEGNYFLQNQVAGLVVYGNSLAQLRSNHFEGNRTALTISQASTPTISGNRITGNGEGIVLLGNARPNLENNIIANNQRNGVVEVASVSPEPTIAASPESIIAASPESPPPTSLAPLAVSPAPTSATPPISISTPVQPTVSASPPISMPTSPQPSVAASPEASPSISIPTTPAQSTVAVLPPISTPTSPHLTIAASPETIAPRETIRSAATPAAEPTVTAEVPPSVSVPVQVTVTPSRGQTPLPPAQPVEASTLPSLPTTDRLNAPTGASISTQPAPTQPRPSAPVVSETPSTSERAGTVASSIPIQVVPASGSTSRTNTSRVTRPAPAASHANRDSQADDAPATVTRATTPTRSADWIPVPDSDVPISSSGGSFNLSLATMELPMDGSPPAPPSRASILGLNYRVLVDASSAQEQQRLRDLVPDAFRTQRDGRSMMQAGAYDNEATAQERMQLLLENGLDARVEYTP
jgi:parallel beta-helix repeat protein